MIDMLLIGGLSDPAMFFLGFLAGIGLLFVGGVVYVMGRDDGRHRGIEEGKAIQEKKAAKEKK